MNFRTVEDARPWLDAASCGQIDDPDIFFSVAGIPPLWLWPSVQAARRSPGAPSTRLSLARRTASGAA